MASCENFFANLSDENLTGFRAAENIRNKRKNIIRLLQHLYGQPSDSLSIRIDDNMKTLNRMETANGFSLSKIDGWFLTR